MIAGISEDEDVTALKYGEFENKTPIGFPALSLLISHLENEEEKGLVAPTTKTLVFEKCKAYVNRFTAANVSLEQNEQIVKCTLDPRYGLTPFEATSIINLRPPNAEQARALIPSLGHQHVGPDGEVLREPIDDESLEALLRDLDNWFPISGMA